MKKENGQFLYEQGADGIIILSYLGEEEELAIPERIDGCPVTEIADGVFEEFGVWVGRLHIPASLKKIGMPYSLGNTKITVDKRNPHYHTDGYALYERCDHGASLVAVYLQDERSTYAVEEGTVQIGENAFCGQSYLQEVLLPDSVAVIGEAAFFMCGQLRHVHMTQGLLKIGEEAFSRCPLLEELSLPAGVRQIAESALTNTFDWDLKKMGLQRITCAEGNPFFYIEEKSLYQKLENGVRLMKYLGRNRVEKLPDTITEIAAYAFRRAKLTSLTLPPSLREIHKDAFLECSVENIIFAGARGMEDIVLYLPLHPVTLREELMRGFRYEQKEANGLYDFAYYGTVMEKQNLNMQKLKMMDCFCSLPTGDEMEKKEQLRQYVAGHFAEALTLAAGAEDAALLDSWCRAGIFSAEQTEEAIRICSSMKKTALAGILLNYQDSQFGAAEFDFTL